MPTTCPIDKQAHGRCKEALCVRTSHSCLITASLMKAICTLVLPTAAFLLGVSVASADPISFNYSISGTAGNNNSPANTTSFVIGGGDSASAGSSPITITAAAYVVGTNDPPTPGDRPTPGVFSGVPISVTVSLTDAAAKAIPGAGPNGTLVFNGLLSGMWNHAMDAWHLTSLPSTETITLGSPGQLHTYTIGAPYLSNPSFGTLLAAAPVQASDYRPGLDPAPGVVSAAPAPASIILAALALPAFLAGRRIRERAARSRPGCEELPRPGRPAREPN
jgi:hypothetical protein